MDFESRLAREQEFLQADLELLRQEVDSMNRDIKLLKVLLDISVTTRKDMSETEQ